MKDKLKYILSKLNDIEEYNIEASFFGNVDNYIKQLEASLKPILCFGHYETPRTGSEMYIVDDINQSYKGPINNESYYRLRAQERVNRILEGE